MKNELEEFTVLNKPKKGDLCVWWIPQVPMKQFIVPVRNIREAKLILDTLADYDQFQLDNNIKPDYSNAGGLCVFDPEDKTEGHDGSWLDWEDDEGNTIDEYDLNGELYVSFEE